MQVYRHSKEDSHGVYVQGGVVKGIVVGMRGGSLFENEAFYSASQLARAGSVVTGCGDSRSMRLAAPVGPRMPQLCFCDGGQWAMGQWGNGATGNG
jgi:hypothetical protein